MIRLQLYAKFKIDSLFPESRDDDSLSLAFLNINSLNNKVNEIEKLLSRYSIDCIALCETRTYPNKDYDINNYKNYIGHEGRGIAFYSQVDIRHHIHKSDDIEYFIIIIKNVLFACLYIPTNTVIKTKLAMLSDFMDMDIQLSYSTDKIIIAGDFNTPYPND